LSDSTQRRALCLALSKNSLEQQVHALQDQVIGSSNDLIRAFASAAAASVPARRVPGTLIARGGEHPGIAVVGDLDDAAIARVGELFDQLEEASGALRYVSYPQAELDVRVLAERLEQRFTRAALDEALFRPVPRGGLIVLGMLAMAMDLRHDQLTAPTHDDGRLVVLVDDCALSGHRIHQTLQATPSQRIALALLYAPLELCRNIESIEDRVQGCVAARRLRDVGPQMYGQEYGAWISRWTQRLGDDRYWIGRPESVAFAWKEPDRSFVNAATGEREVSWRVVPGELAAPTHPSWGGRLEVQLQPDARGPLRPAADVFFGDLDGTVVIVRPAQQKVIELNPVAGAFWRALVAHGSVAAMVDSLRADYDVEPSRLESDAARFVDELLQGGILDANPD
jgi:hypothetical protein